MIPSKKYPIFLFTAESFKAWFKATTHVRLCCLYTVIRIGIRYNRVWVMVLNFLN